MKYEYLVLKFGTHSDTIQQAATDTLNDYASEGWRVVWVTPIATGGIHYTLERGGR